MIAGSLCSGYGGLEMGVAAALGVSRVAWHAEVDPHAAAVLAHHHPDVPNLGDITAVDFTAVEPVDVLCAGYPCQPFSNAGLRKGHDDHRNVWPDVHRAVRVLRPRVVVLENVRGHVRRGFAHVVGTLAAIGYVGRWRCVRASDAGAAHRRERLYVVAWAAGENPPAVPGRAVAGDVTAGPLLPTPAARDHKGPSARGPLPGVASRLLPTPRATDGAKGGPNMRGSSGDPGLPAAVQPGRWGAYADAIHRWEKVTGRAAPDPTGTGRNGGQQLNPVFVEWLMGLPAGWVTDVVARRTAALRVLGNGVVPQAASLAIQQLFAPEVAR